MFQINDVVVYGSQGVCEIVDIDEQKVDGVFKKYFVLKPKFDNGATFYVPTWNEKALGKMRKVMPKKDIDTLIDAMPNKAPIWIANDNERKETYKKILAGGDPTAVISLVQALFLHKKEREAEGKRLHMSDEHFMKEAEQLLYTEWQFVLNVDRAGLMDYIFSRLESNP
jgi:CarD family transcriptional regulator